MRSNQVNMIHAQPRLAKVACTSLAHPSLSLGQETGGCHRPSGSGSVCLLALVLHIVHRWLLLLY